MALSRFAFVAAIALLPLPAFAQAAPAAPSSPVGQPSSQLEAVGLTPPAVLSQGYQASELEVMATDVIGMQVFSATTADAMLLGSIDNFVIGPLGDITAAILALDPAVGAGTRSVAVDFTQFQRLAGPDGALRWVFETPLEALTAAPDFVYPDARPQDAPETALEEAAQLVPGDPNAAPVDPALATDRPATEPVATTTPDPVEAAAILGLGVYGQNDEPIGTVGTVIEAADGTIDAIVVDVGGFLGLGARPVAIGFEGVSVAADTAGTRYVFVNASRAQLEAQPVYDPATYEGERSNQRLVLTP